MQNADQLSLIRRFAFPLNVYAHAILIEHGRLDWLHYGCFARSDEPLPIAQERATALLLDRVGTDPKRILEVGIGVGTLFGRLSELGHTVVGITPEAAQVEYVRQFVRADAELAIAGFEQFAVAEPFDLVLFQESGQYIAQPELLNGAAKQLKHGGELIVVDEFIDRPDAAYPDHLHVHRTFLASAAAVGFSLIEDIDLGAQAAPTVDSILQFVARHQKRLCAELGVQKSQLEELFEGTERYRQAYSTGRYGYHLLRFTYSPSRWRVEPLQASQGAAMRTLFKVAFGSELSEAMWQWKYGTGHGMAMAVWDHAGDLIGHYGGFGRDILIQGIPARALQSGDVMVHPSERGVLTRKGAFFLATTAMWEQQIGNDKPYLLAFGFPNRRAMLVGVRQKLYGDVGRMVELQWSTKPSSPRILRSRVKTFSSQDQHWQRQADRLWRDMAMSLPRAVVGVRESAYLQRRYLDRPGGNYQLVWVLHRLWGHPIGLLVLRIHDLHVEWLDVVAARQHWPTCASAAVHFAKELGKSSVSMWLSSTFTGDFGACTRVQDLDISIACNIWGAHTHEDTLRESWLMTAGDTDFL